MPYRGIRYVVCVCVIAVDRPHRSGVFNRFILWYEILRNATYAIQCTDRVLSLVSLKKIVFTGYDHLDSDSLKN